MRFVIATVLLTLSAITAALGFTLMGPFEANASKRVDFDTKSPYSYVIIPHKTLMSFEGDISIEASGTKEIFFAEARERDIQDWVGVSNFIRLNLTEETNEPAITPITAGGLNAKPNGSDMWRTELTVKNKLRTAVTMYDDSGLLLASNGFNRAPSKISIVWEKDNLVNWPMIVIYCSIGLLALALIMNFVAFRHIRKLKGPRRRIPKAPSGPKYRRRIRPDVPRRGRRALGRSSRRKMVIAPISLISLSLLAGCSSPQAITPEEDSGLEKVSVVVTDGQLQRIMGDLATTVKLADQSRNDKKLATRVSGPALKIRSVQYRLQIKSKKIPALPDLVAKPVTVALPMQLPEPNVGWVPRTVMVVTRSDSTKKAPQMMVLQQKYPRENYKLWYLIDLLPTSNFPKVAAQSTGALSVDETNAYLATPLKNLPYKYGQVLNKELESQYAPEFDLTSDKFYASLSESQSQQKTDLTKVNASISFTHSLGSKNILGMLTLGAGEGGAGGLVAIEMLDTSIIKPKVRGVAVSVTQPDHKILLGAPGSSTGLRIIYSNMLLFYVPLAGSEEKIRLVGASQGILSVKALK